MILLLCGYTATGKDTYQNLLLERNPKLKRAVSHTTRPIRPGEEDGREYHFVSDREYKMLESNGEILSGRTYKTIAEGKQAVWDYGLTYLAVEHPTSEYITIVDHEGVKRLTRALGKDIVKVVYLHATEKTLRARSLVRLDEAAEFNRRLDDDIIKFEGIEISADLMLSTNHVTGDYESNITEIERLLRGGK